MLHAIHLAASLLFSSVAIKGLLVTTLSTKDKSAQEKVQQQHNKCMKRLRDTERTPKRHQAYTTININHKEQPQYTHKALFCFGWLAGWWRDNLSFWASICRKKRRGECMWKMVTGCETFNCRHAKKNDTKIYQAVKGWLNNPTSGQQHTLHNSLC